MLKKIIITGLIFTLLFSAVACSDNEKEEKLTTKPSLDQIYMTSYSEADEVKSYMNIQDLTTDSEDILYGEITDLEYRAEEGIIYTIETVSVEDVIKGDLKKNDSIKIFKLGGYMLLQDLLESYAEEEQSIERTGGVFKDCTDEQLKTLYICQMDRGESDSDIGDKSVFFLNYDEILPDVYNRCGELEGEYVQLEDGMFRKPAHYYEEDIEEMAGGNSLNEQNLQIPTYTYEELLEQINNSNN